MRNKIFYFLIIFCIFIFAVFLRVNFCFDKVFSDPIKYSADDGIYHMRLVENELLGDHFPHRIYFDPYTNFPHGTYEYFAPFYDQLLSVIIWIISLGKPTLELINRVAPFYPVVLGSCLVFLVYFIANSIWDRKTGILSALLISFSGPLLYKSMLGTTDHHVAEVLFSTLSMMFLIFSIKARKKENKSKNNSFLNIIKDEFSNQKKFWIFTILTGFSLGLYFLSWSGALLFLAIIFLFICSFYLFEYLTLKRSNYWILCMGILIFFIVLLMIFPFLNHPDIIRSYMYNIQHLEAIIFGILAFFAFAITSLFINNKKLNRFFIFLPILFLIVILILLKYFTPTLFLGLWQSVKAINTGVVNHNLARELISEMAPLSLGGAFKSFSVLLYISIAGLFLIIFSFWKKRSPKYLLLIIWSLILFLITGIIPFFGQQRFAVYLSINIAILSAFVILKVLRFGWKGLELLKSNSFPPNVRSFVLAGSCLSIFGIIFLIFFPFPFNIVNSFPTNLPQIIGETRELVLNGLIVQEDYVYKTMQWIKDNTPDPKLNYYSLYKEPGIDKDGNIKDYNYPDSAYGILAVWDVGHMITYYAHRMAVANPFQQGIGKKEGDNILQPGEAVFFLETDEKKATGYLDNLKVRYIITDYYSAIPDGGFKQKIKWIQNNDLSEYLEKENSDSPSKFDNSMIARLHMLDGTEENTSRNIEGKEIKFYIKPLNNFRLIYESEDDFSANDDKNKNIKKMKVFEYVKGAKITGKADSGSKIELSTNIKTNQGRVFVYRKEYNIGSNGIFEFTVPYSTFGEKGWIDGQTKYSVFAEPYKVKINGKEIEVNISENQILSGETENIN